MAKTTKYFNEAYYELINKFPDNKNLLHSFTIGILLVSDPYPSKEETNEIMKLIRDEALLLKTARETIETEYETKRVEYEKFRLKTMGAR